MCGRRMKVDLYQSTSVYGLANPGQYVFDTHNQQTVSFSYKIFYTKSFHIILLSMSVHYMLNLHFDNEKQLKRCVCSSPI